MPAVLVWYCLMIFGSNRVHRHPPRVWGSPAQDDRGDGVERHPPRVWGSICAACRPYACDADALNRLLKRLADVSRFGYPPARMVFTR